MPRPNQPEYYTPPELYPALENLISGGCQPADEEQKKVYASNKNNLKAFLQSQILDKTETPEKIAQAFAQVSGHQTDEAQRQIRRQLSAEAREKILNLALDYHISGNDMGMGLRVYLLLLNRTDSPEAQAENENVRKIVQKGDPKEIGRLFEACVKRSVEWYEKGFTNLSDRELIDNLKELAFARDIVMNADNIRKLMDNGVIEISEETRRTLKAMEDNSPWINSFAQRVRAISNPTYEYISIDGFLTLSNDQFEQLKSSVDGESVSLNDYMRMINNARNDGMLIRADNKEALKASLEAVAKANEGNFIGSFAYSQAFRSLRNVVNFVDNMGDPPNQAELNRMKPMLEKTIQKCEKYLQTKDPEAFKNDRERIRYEAMQRTLASCKKTLAFHTRNPETNLEKQPNAKKSADQPWSVREITQAIDGLYGSEGKRFVLPASDAGMIADELRADIHEKLHKLVSDPDNYDEELASYVKANMVVLDMVKKGRTVNQNGEIIAGPIEKALAADPGAVIESLRSEPLMNNAMIGNSLDGLKYFVLHGSAEDVSEAMLKAAEKKFVQENNEPEMQMQMKKEDNGIAPHNA